MAETFGARLRQQRERLEITLTSIAERTKISLPLLEGLERDDVSHWPAGIFRRSFVRAYAQNIGLEPDATVREFLQVYPDPVDMTADASAVAGQESVSNRPPTRLRYLVASAVGSAVGSFTRLRDEVVLKREALKEDIVIADRGSAASAAAQSEREPAEEILSEAEDNQMISQPEHNEIISQPELDLESVPAQPEPDLSDVAHLCTKLGRVLNLREVSPLLESAGRMLDATGLIVWVWDPRTTTLRPAVAHGYSDEVLAKLPRVRRDTENATAASFRSGRTHIVKGSGVACGAVVVPLLTPAVCVGVFTVELRHGGEQKESVRALATIFAAQLTSIVGSVSLAEAVNA